MMISKFFRSLRQGKDKGRESSLDALFGKYFKNKMKTVSGIHWKFHSIYEIYRPFIFSVELRKMSLHDVVKNIGFFTLNP